MISIIILHQTQLLTPFYPSPFTHRATADFAPAAAGSGQAAVGFAGLHLNPTDWSPSSEQLTAVD